MKKIVWLVLTALMVLSLVIASCGTKEEEEAKITEEGGQVITTKEEEEEVEEEEKEEVVTPVGEAKWWEKKWGKPQYGGKITICFSADPSQPDPYWDPSPIDYEPLFMHDYTLDPEIWDFRAAFNPPSRWIGHLVESWEQTDANSLILHIRKGVHWQNKPPVNGREFDAYDVEYHYHRLLGLGSGFTEGTYLQSLGLAKLESVTATDKYTVVLKWPSSITYTNLEATVDFMCFNQPVAREAIQQWGDVQDWRNTITTGAFFLVDHVAATSLTYVKNPDYWGYDVRYPENRLPYLDGVQGLVITDASTRLAGLRTAKIDLLEGLSWEDANTLAKMSPELVQGWRPVDTAGLLMRTDMPPFTDIRVRKAMQMAIDLKSISDFYYGGTVDWKPTGVIGRTLKGYYTPLDEQPEDVQEAYAYNPEGAKKLLAEAGYPDGFKTNVVTTSTAVDLDLLQILISNFNAVGIDMQVKIIESAAFSGYIREVKHDQTYWTFSVASLPFSPIRPLQKWYSGAFQATSCGIADPVYDGLMDKYIASTTEQEIQEWCVKANDYIIAHYWAMFVPPKNTYGAMQPWFKGYNFQIIAGQDAATPVGYLPRCWIDQNLK